MTSPVSGRSPKKKTAAEVLCATCGHQRADHMPHNGPCLVGTGVMKLEGTSAVCKCNHFFDVETFRSLIPDLVDAIQKGEKEIVPCRPWGAKGRGRPKGTTKEHEVAQEVKRLRDLNYKFPAIAKKIASRFGTRTPESLSKLVERHFPKR